MATPQSELTPDEQLGLDAPPPSPDARNQVALKRLYAPIAVALVGVAAVAFMMKEVPPVPSFSAQVMLDGEALVSPARAQPMSKLDLTLTPQGDLGGPINAFVYISKDGKTQRAMDAHAQVDAQGSVHLVGPVRDLLGVSEGQVQVVLLVVRPNGFPETPAAALGEGPWHAERFTLQISAGG